MTATKARSFMEAAGEMDKYAAQQITQTRHFPKILFFTGVLVLFVAALNPAFSQIVEEKIEKPLRIRYGIGGGLDVNTHTADFQQLPGAPTCCPRYETGSGNGLNAGVFVEYPFSASFIAGLRLGFNAPSATLKRDEQTLIMANGTVADGVFTHSVKASLGVVGAEPYFGFYPVSSLMFFGGAGAGLLIQKSYSQQEQITQPLASGTFLDANGNDTGLRTRNQSTGTIDNASMFITAFAGLTYELPLSANRSYVLAPTVSYRVQLGEINPDLKWNVRSVSFGLTFKFSPGPSTIRHQTITDTTPEVITVKLSGQKNTDTTLVVAATTSPKTSVAPSTAQRASQKFVNQTVTDATTTISAVEAQAKSKISETSSQAREKMALMTVEESKKLHDLQTPDPKSNAPATAAEIQHKITDTAENAKRVVATISATAKRDITSTSGTAIQRADSASKAEELEPEISLNAINSISSAAMNAEISISAMETAAYSDISTAAQVQIEAVSKSSDVVLFEANEGARATVSSIAATSSKAAQDIQNTEDRAAANITTTVAVAEEKISGIATKTAETLSLPSAAAKPNEAQNAVKKASAEIQTTSAAAKQEVASTSASASNEIAATSAKAISAATAVARSTQQNEIVSTALTAAIETISKKSNGASESLSTMSTNAGASLDISVKSAVENLDKALTLHSISDTLAEGGEILTPQCCVLQFMATRNRKDATAYLSAIKTKVSNARIKEKPHLDGSLIFQVISDCAPTPQEADQIVLRSKVFIAGLQKTWRINEAPRIICQDIK